MSQFFGQQRSNTRGAVFVICHHEFRFLCAAIASGLFLLKKSPSRYLSNASSDVFVHVDFKLSEWLYQEHLLLYLPSLVYRSIALRAYKCEC